MNITTALKNELAQWLDVYWTTYLKGDIVTWATFIRDDYRNIGGTKEEIWNSKQEIVDYTNSIMDQMIGTVEIRNREIDVIPYGEYMMVHEFTDLYVKIEGEWILYGPFRMSSLLEKTGTGWIALHQHGSYPDMKALEGEAFSIDAVKAENVKLLEAVKSRTFELEIEAALERVRSTSMAMHTSQDLSTVVYTVFTELVKLDAQLDRCLILIVDPQTLGITWYLTGKEGLLSSNGFLVPDNTHPSHQAYLEGWRTKRKMWHYLLVGEEKLRWDAFGFAETELARLPDFIKADMAAVKAIHLSISSDDFGCLIASSLSPLSETHASIVERFTIVFNQTYTRFLDLQKAEAQAREAQIEAALERVRSRSMAMHKSEEFPQVIQVVFEQFLLLDFKIDSAQFDVSFRETDDLNLWTAAPGQPYPTKLHIPYADYEVFNSIKKAKKAGHAFVSIQLTKEEKNDFFNYFFLHAPNIPEERKKFLLSSPGVVRSAVLLEKVSLAIQNYSAIPYSDAEHNILKRFAKVFEQTYTRFLDLQKAEAQASEAKIEAALERVRSKTMAMHKSEQLPETAQVLFEQFAVLGKTPDRMSIGVYNEELRVSEWWVTDQEGIQIKHQFTAPLQEPTHAKMFSAWKEGKESIVIELEGDDLKEWVTFVRQVVKMPMDESRIKGRRVHQAAFFSQGQLLISSHEALPVETVKLLVRFAKVFSQTYTRFLDLQKAEAQAREAQIEASLERVRAHTMGMQSSNDLSNVASVMFNQMKNLGGELFSFAIVLCDKQKDMVEQWHNIGNEGMLPPFFVPVDLDYIHRYRYDQWKAGSELFSIEIPSSYITRHFELMFELPSVHAAMADATAQGVQVEIPAWEMDYGASFRHGYLLISSFSPFKEDHIFPRFAKVFDQAYTRFLDLQKAEAQAREAQIESALERVRSRSMAMHKSDELEEVIIVVSEQLQHLQFRFHNVSFSSNNEQEEIIFWLATPGKTNPLLIHVPYLHTPAVTRITEARKNGLDFFADALTTEENQEWLQHTVYNSSNNLTEDDKKFLLTRKGMARSAVLMKHITLTIVNYAVVPYTGEQNHILKRFGNGFEQAYTRFLDLQKAESQTREAQIEAALERIRSRALAMHRSEEFSDVAKVMREQMGYLGQPELETSAVHLYDEDADNIFSWRAFRLSSYLEGNIISGFFKIPKNSCAIAIEFIQKFNSNATEYTIEVSGEKQTEWYKILFKLAPEVDEAMKISGTTKEKRYYHFSKFSGGALLMVSSKEPANDAIELQKRSAQVFDLAYRRFKDLQKAEAQALEAIKRASVDRVRAEIASMRTTSDLDRIQPLIWNELKTLGVPFIRCGVFIMDEAKQELQAFLSTPDGKPIAAFHLPYHSTDQSMQIVAHWQQKKIFRDHMDEKAFADYTNNLVQQGAVASDEKYVTENRPTDLYLHFLPFLQGMLYVGNDAALNDDELQLVQNLADAFSTAYARYEDFNKLDLAKTAVESAMSELKATQSQLVQQEKLASLGQLTAGIAHEIKNPLNFVNNFSEVSIELIDEVLQEIEKNQDTRDETLISDILKDIRSNVQKVHDHGYRANSIVTSMLQHSRGGTGKLHPTDLNALIKEYVNLSYHGMRASKTPIDVDIVLDLDPALGIVSLIKEDFTRVVINLSNNAFDAMREKIKIKYEGRNTKYEGRSKKDEGENAKYEGRGTKDEEGEEHRVEYKPTLSIQTILENGKVLIQFKDNGPGIPDEIKDKILQPFFTTKKGTEGTGLGLSITNDIVKAHGGELKVETKEGEGSVFIIQIPNH